MDLDKLSEVRNCRFVKIRLYNYYNDSYSQMERRMGLAAERGQRAGGGGGRRGEW